MKKILLISNMYPSKNNEYYGIFVKNVEELLRNNDYLVSKVVIIKHKNIIIKLFSYIIFHLKVIILGLFNNYDYLYVHFVSHSSLGAIIVKKIKKNVKLILNCHGNDVVVDNFKDFKNVKRSKKYLKYADRIVVPSNYFKNILIDNYNINKDLIFIYPSGGVNTNLFINKDIVEAKNKCKLNQNYNYIGYISRIETDKGWDIFIKMIKELEEKNIIKEYNLKFIIVGSGSEENEMDNIIDNLDVKKYIIRKKFVSQEQLVNLYNCLDLFVFPTYRKSDSLGLVGLEAMSTETFVIASDKYGPSDYMINEVNGYTFKSEDVKDLVSKVIKYYEDDDKEKIKKEARNTALKYDIENTKNKILEIFDKDVCAKDVFSKEVFK